MTQRLLAYFLFFFAWTCDGEGRTDNMCEKDDHVLDLGSSSQKYNHFSFINETSLNSHWFTLQSKKFLSKSVFSLSYMNNGNLDNKF